MRKKEMLKVSIISLFIVGLLPLVSAQQVNQGDSIVYEIFVNNGIDVYGYQFDIAYNQNVLSFQKITQGPFLSQDGNTLYTIAPDSSQAGMLKNLAATRQRDQTTGAGSNGLSGTGKLVQIEFTAISSGDALLSLGNQLVLNSQIAPASGAISTNVMGSTASGGSGNTVPPGGCSSDADCSGTACTQVVGQDTPYCMSNGQCGCGPSGTQPICPMPACVAPRPGCHMQQSNQLDANGCPLHPCGIEVCPTAVCGNGVMESGEECDGNDFGGLTCVGAGFTGGSLSCNNCNLVTSSCTSGSGNTGGFVTPISGFMVRPARSGALIVVEDDVVWGTAYYAINRGSWQSFKLGGSSAGQGWIAGRAVEDPRLASGTVHVAVYSCSLVSNNWDCHGGWQLAQFQIGGS